MKIFYHFCIQIFFFHFYFQEEKNCGAPCHAMFFAESERTVLRYWVGSWAALCCASCLFTVNYIILINFKQIQNISGALFNIDTAEVS